MFACGKWLVAIFSLLLGQAVANAQAQTVADLDWQIGPTTGKIGDKATIKVPDGYAFLDRVETKKMMDLGERLRAVAAVKVLRLNAAYAILESAGLLKES